MLHLIKDPFEIERLRQEEHRIAQESWEEAVALSNQIEAELDRKALEVDSAVRK
jgi:hypothetical protein